MRIYISADIEGIGGINAPEHCDPYNNTDMYKWGLAQMEKEVSTVAENFLKQGAELVLINDAHYTMTNLRQDFLTNGVSKKYHGKIALLSGKPKPVAMVTGLNHTFDAACLIGYHAKASTWNGILAHSFHSALLDVSINGTSYGEGGVNSLYSSLVHQVPVILASGDNLFCREIGKVLPNIKTVTTKIGQGFAAAIHFPRPQIKAQYQKTIEELALNQNKWGNNIVELTPPYTLELTVIHPVCADTIMTIPNWVRINGIRLRQTFDDFHQLYLGLQSAYSILSYAKSYYR